MEDFILLTKAKSGNEEALGQLIEKYYFLVFSLIRSKCSCVDIAEDLTQETFIRFTVNLNKIYINKSVKSYILGISKYVVADYYRKSVVDSIVLDLNNIVIQEERVSENLYLEELLKTLNEEEKIILYLFHYEGFTFTEISSQLNKKESTIKSIYYRSISKLKGVVNFE